MASEILKPSRGGFLRAFGCGEFIRDFLAGSGPYGSLVINPHTGACQADIFFQYKTALIKETALDRATRMEEKRARKEKRYLSPENIQALSDRIAAHLPYKSHGARFHSFGVYFSMLQRLEWVEATGKEEPSAFQEHYPGGQPRKYFRLTARGTAAAPELWTNPQRALYQS